jgi:CheY-like chemotaxis protein
MTNLDEVEILIVEDNPNDAEMALRALKKNNLTNRVLVVGDGEEALDFVFSKGKYVNREKGARPKIILLDLKLPKIDGLEVLKEIKSNEETKVIPVIVLTSSKEESDIVESYRLGVNSYIVKPVDFEKFVDAVRELGLYWLLLNQYPLNNS